MQRIALLTVIACICNSFAYQSSANASDKTLDSASNTKNALVDTGQVSAYDSNGLIIDAVVGDRFYGQDAHYTGIDFAFSITNDGRTVFDSNTALTWQREASETRVSWRDAKAYCSDLTLAAHDDWRLPSIRELLSIEDFKEGWPYINTDFFSLGDQPIGKQLQYWSGNLYLVGTAHGGVETAFGLNFATGHIKGYPTGDNNGSIPPPTRPGEEQPGAADSPNRPPPPPGGGHSAFAGNPAFKLVRCVYGDPYGENDFVDNGDGTIVDLSTGLMWQKSDSGKGVDWEEALLMAQNSEFAGYSDWRLPNVKELQSIVDYSGVYPAIDQNFFDITDKDSYFWSSTSAYFSKYGSVEQEKKYWAWYVAFGYAVGPDGNDSHGAGAIRYDSKSEGGPVGEDAERVYNYARAVRNVD